MKPAFPLTPNLILPTELAETYISDEWQAQKKAMYLQQRCSRIFFLFSYFCLVMTQNTMFQLCYSTLFSVLPWGKYSLIFRSVALKLAEPRLLYGGRFPSKRRRGIVILSQPLEGTISYSTMICIETEEAPEEKSALIPVMSSAVDGPAEADNRV